MTWHNVFVPIFLMHVCAHHDSANFLFGSSPWRNFFAKEGEKRRFGFAAMLLHFLGSKCKRHFRWNKNEHIQPQWTRYSELYFKSSAMSQHIVKTELLDWKGRDSRGKGSNIRIQRSTSNINDRFHHVLQKKNKK